MSNMRRPSSSSDLDDMENCETPKSQTRKCSIEAGGTPKRQKVSDKINLFNTEQSQETDHDAHESNLALLQQHLAKQDHEVSDIKSLMHTTFSTRKKWIIEDIPPVYQILDLFPSLKKVKCLMCELKCIVERDDSLEAFPTMFKDGKAKFMQLQSKIRRYAKLESETSRSLVALLEKQSNELSFCLDAVDDLESTNETIDTSNLESMHTFQQLEYLLLPKLFTNTSVINVLTDPFDDLEELAKRDKRNYPYITAVNNSGTMQFFLIVERIVFTKTSDFFKALWGLIAA